MYKGNLKNARVKIILISSLTIVSFAVLIFTSVYPFFYHDTIIRIMETFRYRLMIMESQVKYYPDVILPGQRPVVLMNRIFSYPINSPVFLIPNMLVTAYGFFYGIKNIYKKRINKTKEFYLILVISSIILCGPVLFTPLDWVRYYLLPIFFTCIFFAIGICQLNLFLINVKPEKIKYLVSKDNLIFYWKRGFELVQRLFKPFHNWFRKTFHK